MVEGKPDGCIRNKHDDSCGAIFRSGDDWRSHLWMFPQNGFTNRVLQCRSSGGLANSLGIFITDGSEFISSLNPCTKLNFSFCKLPIHLM